MNAPGKPAPVDDTENEIARLNRHLAGRYHVEDVIGTGAVGTVYRATDTALNRKVAIKLIRLPFRAAEKWRDRFREEARIVAAFAHTNILQVHEIIDFGDTPLIVMEYVEGDTLDDALRNPTDRTWLINAMITVSEAVGYAHAQGIIHCDIKPQNILLPKDGSIKIADFGIAVRAAEEGATSGAPINLRKKTIRGSPAYMSPEQARGATWELSARTDVFGIGATLYYGLTGARIYHGSAEEMIAQAKEGDILPPRAITPDLSRDLEAVCMKCLAKEPCQRYDTAEQLAADLRRCRDGLPVSARHYSFGAKIGRAIAYRKFTFALTTAVVLLTMAGAITAHTLAHRAATNSILSVIQERVKGLANTAAMMIDPEDVQAVRTPADRDRTSCKNMVRILKSIKERNDHIDYVYVARKAEQPGFVSFVAMDSFDDPNGNLTVGDVYKETPKFPEMLAAFEGPAVDRTINMLDEWNVALSGYAPIRDRDGNAIAIVGVDIKSNELSDVLHRINEAYQALVTISVVSHLMLIVLITAWFVGKWERKAYVMGSPKVRASNSKRKAPVAR